MKGESFMGGSLSGSCPAAEAGLTGASAGAPPGGAEEKDPGLLLQPQPCRGRVRVSEPVGRSLPPFPSSVPRRKAPDCFPSSLYPPPGHLPPG